MEIHISAPGKVILHGEHAVVYGKAALAASLNLRCHLTLTTGAGSDVSLDLPDVSVHRRYSLSSIKSDLLHIINAGSIDDPSPASDEVIAALKSFVGIDAGSTETKYLALTAFLYIFCGVFKHESQLPSVSVHMKSELPVGAGLGSSAAFSVSTSAALLQLAGHIQSEKLQDGTAGWTSDHRNIINKWAFIGEKLIHGRPSGIDNSVSTFGGAIRFQNGQITFIDKMPTLKVILVNTRVPRSTLVLVAGLREKYNQYPEIFEPIFNSVEAITKKAESVYSSLHDKDSTSQVDDTRDQDFKTLEDLIDLNQQLLNLMGVGHTTLDQVVALARIYQLHSKLTGAGGGGCAFVLVPPGIEESAVNNIKEDLKELGFDVWADLSIGGFGVLQHL